jgi:stage II sporulation protein AA (anti-sigma F factor antagonist)
MTDADVHVDHASERTVRIAVTGEIDMDNAAQVEQQILAAISNQLTSVTLDIGGLDYLDSAGLRVLFTLGTRLEDLQIAGRLLVPTESPIRRVVDLSGVAGAIPVSPS